MRIKGIKSISGTTGLLLAAGLVMTTIAAAQTVEKVADFNFASMDGVGVGGYAPQDRFTQVGTNLWFTTKSGGTYDAGTISRFNLVTREIIEVASFDNNTGKASESSLLIVDGEGYFTTVNGGTGNKGTIAKVNLDSGAITVLHNFPSDSSTGATPRAGLTRIGDELWTTTSLGGTSNRGVIVKFNLTNNVTTVVTNLDGPVLGGQPYGGLLKVDDDYYFTTPIGGNSFATTANIVGYTLPGGETVLTTNNLSLGAGTLQRMTLDGSGNPTFERLVNLRGGFEQFCYSEPVQTDANTLFFATIGPNSTPGALMRYDLNTGFSTNVFVFPTNEVYRVANGTRPGYNGLLPWQDELYFINRSGGTSNLGTVVKFNVKTSTLTKLADLEGKGAASLGSASSGANSGLVVLETNRFFAYFPLAVGGANGTSGYGTIIRVSLPPLPIQQTGLAFTNNGTNLVLSWSGGYPPFDVLSNADISAAAGSWTVAATNINSTANTTNWSVTLPVEGASRFYRIRGQAQ